MRALTPREVADYLDALRDLEEQEAWAWSHRFAWHAILTLKPWTKDSIEVREVIGDPPWERRAKERELEAARDEIAAAAARKGLVGPWRSDSSG